MKVEIKHIKDCECGHKSHWRWEINGAIYDKHFKSQEKALEDVKNKFPNNVKIEID